jgi:hypothetical protein
MKKIRINIWKNKDGVHAIEYAFALPIFLLFFCVCVEYALMAFADVQFNSGVFNLSRVVRTGQFNDSLPPGSNLTQIQTATKNALITQLTPSALFKASNITISSESFSSFASIGPIEPCVSPNVEPCNNAGQYNDLNSDGVRNLQGGFGGTGAGNSVIIYTANYKWEGITPVWKLINVVNGTNFVGGSTLSSSILLKNEPFPGAR